MTIFAYIIDGLISFQSTALAWLIPVGVHHLTTESYSTMRHDSPSSRKTSAKIIQGNTGNAVD